MNSEVFISFLSLFVAIIALLYTIYIDWKNRKREEKQFQTNLELTSKINSKEYQIYEDLKYSLMQVIASIRSIDAKAAVGIDSNNNPFLKEKHKPDFSFEIEIIKKMQSSPGYLIFLHSINDNKARFEVEAIFRNLSEKLSLMDYSLIRESTHLLMKYIQNNLNKELMNDEVYKMMNEFCEMEGVFTNFNYDKLMEYKEEAMSFKKYLEEKKIYGCEWSFSDEGIQTNMPDVYNDFQKQRKQDL